MSSKEKKGSARYRPVFLGLQIRRNDFYTTEPGLRTNPHELYCTFRAH